MMLPNPGRRAWELGPARPGLPQRGSEAVLPGIAVVSQAGTAVAAARAGTTATPPLPLARHGLA